MAGRNKRSKKSHVERKMGKMRKAKAEIARENEENKLEKRKECLLKARSAK